MQGIVDVVESDERVLVRPTDEMAKGLSVLPFTARELRKYFTIGDHVRALAGAHQGESGMVVQVSGGAVEWAHCLVALSPFYAPLAVNLCVCCCALALCTCGLRLEE